MARTRMALTFTLAGMALAAAAVDVRAGWGIGVGIGAPVYYRPWGPYPYYYPYYGYRPVYVAPPPVVIESPPVAVPSAPALQPIYQAAPSSAPTPTIVRTQGQEVSQADISHYLQLLRDPDEQVRADTVVQLGRLKALASVDPLAATLAGDRSPMVREAAARALALLGSPKALPALQRAASADPDRDVRHSAQFAIDIVQSRP
jgi:hypothetical protein